jgi:regulator of RNase E activity RraA
MSSAKSFQLLPTDTLITSAMISDSLDAVGSRSQVLTSDVVPLVAGSRYLGRAATVAFTPSDQLSENPYDDAISFIDSLTLGDVAVVATDGNLSTAYWGELFSAAAIGRGAVGMVTDGTIRDTTKIAGLGFPAFSRGHRPIDFHGRMRVSAQGRAVTIAGVTVNPGDLISADDDGVVVVPHEIADEVLQRARSRATAEGIVLSELLVGASLRGVWDRHHIL